MSFFQIVFFSEQLTNGRLEAIRTNSSQTIYKSDGSNKNKNGENWTNKVFVIHFTCTCSLSNFPVRCRNKFHCDLHGDHYGTAVLPYVKHEGGEHVKSVFHTTRRFRRDKNPQTYL